MGLLLELSVGVQYPDFPDLKSLSFCLNLCFVSAVWQDNGAASQNWKPWFGWLPPWDGFSSVLHCSHPHFVGPQRPALFLCAPAPAMAAAFSPWKGRLGVWNKSLLCLRTGHWYSCLHPGVSLRYLSGVTPLTQPSLRTQSRSLLVWRLQCSWGLCGACCACGRGDAWLTGPPQLLYRGLTLQVFLCRKDCNIE